MEKLKNDIQELFTDTSFQTCHLTGNGVIREIEEMIQNYYDKKYVLTFPNATTAIWSLILALNLQNKVIASSSFGWAGAIAPFLLFSNKVLFTSNDSSLNMNGLNNLPRNEGLDAIFSIDYGGIPADSQRLKSAAQNAGAILISDSSQSFGAARNGKPAGFWADAIILSFTSSKSVNCMEGGAVVTDDERIYERLLLNSQHPYRQKMYLGARSFNEFVSVNGRMHPLSAMFLKQTFSDQLEELATIQDKYYRLYQQLVSGNLIKEIPEMISPDCSTYFDFLVEPFNEDNNLIEALNRAYADFHFRAVQLLPFWLRDGFNKKFSFTKVEIQYSTYVLNRIKITLKT
jgi:dTDP-4-amino-4,6-dideoxygalactose transaminase